MAWTSRAVRGAWSLLGALALASCGSDQRNFGGTAGAGGQSSAGEAGLSGSAAHSGSAGRAGSAGAVAGGDQAAGEGGEPNGGDAGASTEMGGTAGSAGASVGAGTGGIPGAGTGGTAGGGTSGAGISGGGTSGGGTSGAGTSGGGTSGGGSSGAGTSGAGTSGAGTSGAGTSGAGVSGGGAGGSAGASSTLGPAPLNLVAFYQASTTACPTGWTRLATADGRMLLATSGSGVGSTLGLAFGNLENRSHTHAYTTQIFLGNLGLNTTGGGNTNFAAGGNIQLTGTTQPAFSGLPYSQLLVCKLTEDLGQGDGFPTASVAFFDQTTCPTNWAAYTAANNRIILPAAGASGVMVGNGTSVHHQHSLDFSINLLTSSAAVGAGSFSPIATSGLVTSTSLSDFGNDGVDQPTLTLLACRKSAAAETNAVVPSGATTFLDDATCPATWERYTDQEGRFLVGASMNIGSTFGQGGPLASGEERTHTHQGGGLVTLPPKGVSASLGSLGSYGKTNSMQYNMTAGPGSVSPPRIELRHCRKQ